PLVDGTTLTIEVCLDGATQRFNLDLGWAKQWAEDKAAAHVAAAVIATELRTRLVEQLQRETAGLDVWLVPASVPLPAGPVVSDRLQLEARVAGKRARLRPQGDAAVQALGFAPDPVIGHTLNGAGDADDAEALRPAEVQAAFQQAIAQMTLLTGVATIDVREVGAGNIELSATALSGPAPAVTANITPADLQTAINPTAAAGKL